MGNRSIKGSEGVMLPMWEYLGGEVLTPGGANAVATLPTNTEIVHIVAEDGDIYYSFSPIASANSPGFIAENLRIIEGPIRDLNTKGLSVFGAAGAIAHIQYYRENRGR